MAAAIGIVAVDGGAARVLARIHVRSGADRDVHLLALAIEQDGAGPVSAGEALERHHLFAGAHLRYLASYL